jgi:hypothetical protein
MVLLPAPFFPARPILSLWFIRKLTFSNKENPPKLTVIPFNDIISRKRFAKVGYLLGLPCIRYTKK